MLSTLSLENCSLTDNVGVFSALTRLTSLILSSNSFSGSLAGLDALTHLQVLRAARAHMQGSIAPLGALPALIDLDLRHNALSGSLSPLQGSPVLVRALLGFNAFSEGRHRQASSTGRRYAFWNRAGASRHRILGNIGRVVQPLFRQAAQNPFRSRFGFSWVEQPLCVSLAAVPARSGGAAGRVCGLFIYFLKFLSIHEQWFVQVDWAHVLPIAFLGTTLLAAAAALYYILIHVETLQSHTRRLWWMGAWVFGIYSLVLEVLFSSVMIAFVLQSPDLCAPINEPHFFSIWMPYANLQPAGPPPKNFSQFLAGLRADPAYPNSIASDCEARFELLCEGWSDFTIDLDRQLDWTCVYRDDAQACELLDESDGIPLFLLLLYVQLGMLLCKELARLLLLLYTCVAHRLVLNSLVFMAKSPLALLLLCVPCELADAIENVSGAKRDNEEEYGASVAFLSMNSLDDPAQDSGGCCGSCRRRRGCFSRSLLNTAMVRSSSKLLLHTNKALFSGSSE